jgi:hypothetical protein
VLNSFFFVGLNNWWFCLNIEFLQQDINKTRQTTASYLDELVSIGLMEKIKHGKSNYYINKELFDLFAQ